MWRTPPQQLPNDTASICIIRRMPAVVQLLPLLRQHLFVASARRLERPILPPLSGGARIRCQATLLLLLAVAYAALKGSAPGAYASLLLALRRRRAVSHRGLRSHWVN